MRLNRTCKWKVMTILISQELPLFNFERLDILWTWIRHPCEKLWPFEFLKSFCCSISSVSIYYVLESDIRVKSFDHLNFSRASVVQLQASLYIMRLNLTSELKVMNIWISRELPLFNFERLDILCARIWPPSEKLWPFWNSRELPLFNFELLFMWCPKSVIRVKSYDHLNFSRAFVVQFRTSWYIMRLNRRPIKKLWIFDFHESFRCLISSVSIYYAPESDLRVKSYDQFNFSRASVVQFRASRYIMDQNQTSMWKVMTIWISQELPLLNFERLDILRTWIGHPSEK